MDFDELDILKLRQDLEDYFLGIMFNVSKAAVVELSRVENASVEELIQIALENDIDLNNYVKSKYY